MSFKKGDTILYHFRQYSPAESGRPGAAAEPRTRAALVAESRADRFLIHVFWLPDDLPLGCAWSAGAAPAVSVIEAQPSACSLQLPRLP